MNSLILWHLTLVFCEDMCVQTKTFCTCNNKPWFTPKAKRSYTEKLRNNSTAYNTVSVWGDITNDYILWNLDWQMSFYTRCGVARELFHTHHPGQWMMQLTWDFTTGSITSTPQGPTQGSWLWTSGWRVTPSSPRSSTRGSPSSLCHPPPVSGSQAFRSSTDACTQECVLSPLLFSLYTNDCTS